MRNKITLPKVKGIETQKAKPILKLKKRAKRGSAVPKTKWW